ncbi:hypothetical protein ABPG74_016406 [Tetrahymena malaccensis]
MNISSFLKNIGKYFSKIGMNDHLHPLKKVRSLYVFMTSQKTGAGLLTPFFELSTRQLFIDGYQRYYIRSINIKVSLLLQKLGFVLTNVEVQEFINPQHPYSIKYTIEFYNISNLPQVKL